MKFLSVVLTLCGAALAAPAMAAAPDPWDTSATYHCGMEGQPVAFKFVLFPENRTMHFLRSPLDEAMNLGVMADVAVGESVARAQRAIIYEGKPALLVFAFDRTDNMLAAAFVSVDTGKVIVGSVFPCVKQPK